MGCDIHFYVEKKIENNWMPVMGISPYDETEKTYRDWAYGARNYNLFAVLANVRNYDDDIIPVDDPRGLPTDVSAEIGHISDGYADDGHSHSHLLLSEIIAANSPHYEGDFKNRTIPLLKQLADGDDTSVRAVFWFDN